VSKKQIVNYDFFAEEASPRHIVSQYLYGHKETRVTRAKYASKAVPNAVMHMQMDDYQANVCQVWDESTGELHAVIKRNVKGAIYILFSRTPVRGQ
jgi:hypothetical protein